MTRSLFLGLLLAELVLTGCKDADDASRKKDEIKRVVKETQRRNQEEIEKKEANRPIPELVVDYPTLLDKFLENCEAAKGAYHGKRIEIQANVARVMSKKSLVLEGRPSAEGRLGPIVCQIEGPTATAVMGLSYKQKVRIVGQLETHCTPARKIGDIDSTAFVVLSFRDCHLEELEATRNLIMSTAELAQMYEKNPKEFIEKFKERSVLSNGKVVRASGHADRIVEFNGTGETRVTMEIFDESMRKKILHFRNKETFVQFSAHISRWCDDPRDLRLLCSQVFTDP